MSMKYGICPKCNSQEVYKRRAIKERLPIGVLGHVPMLYVCTECGYYEHYIDEHLLVDIRRGIGWSKVRK